VNFKYFGKSESCFLNHRTEIPEDIAPILWNQLRVTSLIPSLLVFLISCQSLSFGCSVRSRCSTFRFFMLVTQVFVIPKASAALPLLGDSRNTCPFSMMVSYSRSLASWILLKLCFEHILYRCLLGYAVDFSSSQITGEIHLSNPHPLIVRVDVGLG
jgi:hypothetical protein